MRKKTLRFLSFNFSKRAEVVLRKVKSADGKMKFYLETKCFVAHTFLILVKIVFPGKCAVQCLIEKTRMIRFANLKKTVLGKLEINVVIVRSVFRKQRQKKFRFKVSGCIFGKKTNSAIVH